MTILDDLDKREALRRIIRAEDVKNAIIFCNRKRDVDILHKSLSKHGFNAGCLHGDMAQAARMETLAKFKAGEVTLLVASDVAARGIDVSDLSHVFNFDVPISPDDYVHRIGRTGRAGKTGRAFMLATPEETRALLAIEKLTGQEIPRHVVDGIESLPLMSDEELKARKRGRGRISQRSGQRSDEARGGRGDRDRGRGRDRDRKGGRDRAYGRAEAKLAEIAADLPIAAEATKPEAPRPEHPKREDRWDNRRNRGEGSRGDERRDGDDRTVIGFGEFTPAFMLRKPTLPPPLDAEGSEVPREARRAGQPIRAESVAFEEEKAETANREGKPAARSRKRKPKGSPEIGPEIGQTAAEPAGGEAVAEESASVTAPEAAPAAKPKRAASRKPKAAAKTAAASDQPDVEAAAPSDAPAKPRRGRAAAAKAKPEAADIGASAGKSRARRKAPRKADADTAAPPEGDDQN